MSAAGNTLFAGCRPEVAAGPDGNIIAVGVGARAAAGRGASVIEVSGRAMPGLCDAHIHLHWLALGRLNLDLTASTSLESALDRIRHWSAVLPAEAWVVGRGWYNDAWADSTFPDRLQLDEAAGGRPAILTRKDGHSIWVSTAGLRAAGIDRTTPAPAGGVIDRDAGGEASGILRETAIELVRRVLPEPGPEQLDAALEQTLRQLARLGLTAVHSMDPISCFASLQRLRRAGRLPIRVVYNLPLSEFDAALRLGVQSGFGDERLRVWGVKAFLDGSLGSRTAQMLDGSGVSVLPQSDLVELAHRAAAGRLNLCLHAIGDGAVRRALDALQPLAGAWDLWRPRIEHAQIVHPADQPRFAAAGVIASMQPIHAIADRELADREWGKRVAHAYPWQSLAASGARLAFGSDAPVESADPLVGIDAATSWRWRVGWFPDQALNRAAAMAAYTRGAAYAAGTEARVGRLTPGRLCDLTVVDGGQVVATVVGGRAIFTRRRRPASGASFPGAH